VGVNVPPVILVQPVSYSNAFPGDYVQFNVAAAGSEPLMYQRNKGDALISQANSSILLRQIAHVNF